MRPGWRSGVVASALALLGACTTAFGAAEAPAPDVPARSDGGVDAAEPRDVASGPEAATTIDTKADAAANPNPSFPPACDAMIDPAKIDCKGKTMPNCSANFPSYPYGAGDLVECSDEVAKCVRHCPNGCAVSKPGLPDQCDDCSGRADGWYCGRDLRGYDLKLGNMVINCIGGKQSSQLNCGNGVSGFCETKCTRTPPAAVPSCCNAP